MVQDLRRSEFNKKTNKLPSSVLTGRIEYELELLQRHVEMLKIIMKNEPIGIIKLSNLSKIPQHKVRYSLRILEQESLIQPSPDGAITTKKCKEFMPKLKHILDGMEKTIKELKSNVKGS
jgi:predicted transcriptional regulator